MILSDLLKLFQSAKYIIISTNQLKDLIANSIIVFEEDTFVSGYVRILKFDDTYLFQEQTPKGKILIRKFSDRKSAENLAKERLEIYENMWNGCGCKVDYFK